MTLAIESIAAATLASTQSVTAGSGSVPATFAHLMQGGLNDLDASVGAAESAMRELASGKPVALHEVMITMERARISVQTFVHIRNKLVESYQDLMRMQL